MSIIVQPGQFIQFSTGIVNKVVDTATYPFCDPDTISVMEATYSVNHGKATVIPNEGMMIPLEDMEQLNFLAATLVMKWGYNGTGLEWDQFSGEYVDETVKIPCNEFQPIIKMNNAMELVGALLNEGYLYKLAAVVEDDEVLHMATFYDEEAFSAKAETPQLALTLAALKAVGLQITLSDTKKEKKIEVGSILKFSTGYVCKVISDEDTQSHLEIGEISLSDATYYIENGGCEIVPADKYVQPDGSLRMEIVTSSLMGCMRHMHKIAVAVCNELPDVQVIITKKDKLKLVTGKPFDESAYVTNTWTKKAL